MRSWTAFIVCLLYLPTLVMHAQHTHTTTPGIPGKHGVYLELSGIGTYGTLNYEYRLTTRWEAFVLAGHAGLSWFRNPTHRSTDGPHHQFDLPLRVMAIQGAGPNKFVIGTALNLKLLFGERYLLYKGGGHLHVRDRKWALYPYLFTGYRYQKEETGLFFQVLVYPFSKYSLLQWADCYSNCIGYRGLGSGYYKELYWSPATPPQVKFYLFTVVPVIGISIGYTFPVAQKEADGKGSGF